MIKVIGDGTIQATSLYISDMS